MIVPFDFDAGGYLMLAKEELPGGGGRADRKQVEIAHHTGPACPPPAVRRAAKRPGGHQSKGAAGMITGTVCPEVPPRVECALSESGEFTRPIISSMEAWEWAAVTAAERRQRPLFNAAAFHAAADRKTAGQSLSSPEFKLPASAAPKPFFPITFRSLTGSAPYAMVKL